MSIIWGNCPRCERWFQWNRAAVKHMACARCSAASEAKKALYRG